MVGRLVDRFDADQPPAAKAEYREVPVGRVAAGDRQVMTGGDSGNLQLEVSLIAPEPRHLLIRFRPAGETSGHASPLIDGVLHRFEANSTSGEGGREVCAIADCRDRWISAGQVLVDHDTVCDLEPGF